MAGRRPIPTVLKMIRGNPGGRPYNEREPKPIGDLKASPPHFDQELEDAWNYAIENSPPGLLKKVDGPILEAWCVALVLHRRATVEVRKFGMLMKAPNTGLPIQSPYLPIVNRQAVMMARLAIELGFSPASRSRIVIGDLPVASASDWDSIATG